VWGLTWVGWLNFLVLRWFFVRLAYKTRMLPVGRFLTSAPKGGTALVEIDFVGDGLRVGDGPLRVSSTGTLPPGLSASTDYWVARPPTRWSLNRWIWPVPWAACRYVGGWRGAARDLARQQTPADREEQALDFAYGNLAASTNHKPARSAFAELAAKRGWSPEQFAAWADARRWWTREGRP